MYEELFDPVSDPQTVCKMRIIPEHSSAWVSYLHDIALWKPRSCSVPSGDSKS